MVHVKLKHFKFSYMMVRPFVHVAFSFGRAHIIVYQITVFLRIMLPIIHDKLKEFRPCIQILRKYN